ncbi:MAG: type II toxin-antitoxin system RelE/ParE family toxin [Desulfovibrio sp.]|uniref:type II toxin-antitoxin system RelE/ParE family toxin n=1 Tax=Desulfovibrio sp. TaxID=885 RepID=UPI0025C1B05A|nr:type II toxin-antitoxin system RelE/ParE family toxin [Desulfovibrio sp.]MBS6829343.1 type II toxin-antitoxin system RelE/ParE family toxin [Desulfovibrio sp.]
MGLFKKRLALPGKGKRGSARTLIATNRTNRWVFIFGFEKNEKENLTLAERSYLQMLAQDLLEYADSDLDTAIIERKMQEVHHA